ncbi:conserved hypothetical protein [Roseibium sp. TrichSKD4]|uniref:hypothetical protein n=1 Tax=Roseibium sp. TrichSKD4 TaxID=744980 RepID=UPI0001E56C5B|nr:hypothetical protein [Roseibium sp. TrichSKD4]EFO31440.1 conserved hypothetical protein [Roseibium sp. TrichSKD4]
MSILQKSARSMFAGLIIASTVLTGFQAQAASPMLLGGGKLFAQGEHAKGPVKTIHDKKRRHNHRGDGRHWHDHGSRWDVRPLRPRQIRRSLRHRGFRAIQIIDRRRGAYVVRAVGWRGRPVKLVVDARPPRLFAGSRFVADITGAIIGD